MYNFAQIKEMVDVKDACAKYGIEVKGNSMALCPFHNDKNPSMKVDKRFHCFGCQEDGDVIDFVSKLFDLSTHDACEKIIKDFGIPAAVALSIDPVKVHEKQSSAEANEECRPFWFDGRIVKEKEYIDYFEARHPLIFSGSDFFDIGGRLPVQKLKSEIAKEISNFVKCNISQTVDRIVKAMEIYLYRNDEDVKRETEHISFLNGDFYLADQKFVEDTEIKINRLPVSFNPYAPDADIWKSFLNDLLEEDDIRTLQQFMGYCLLPTNAAQKMLLMIGDGGEGKSVVGEVFSAIFGENAAKTKISAIAENRFALATLENKLITIDDDMKMSALKDTEILKQVITCNGKMSVERKGKDAHEANIYSRIIAFSNGSLSSLHDRSEGFFRRQIPIIVKPKDPNRVNIYDLAERIIAEELEGIVVWAINGLYDLIGNDYNFKLSERSKNALNEIKKDGNNIIPFLESKGFIYYGKDETTTSKALYESYCEWASANNLEPYKRKSFDIQVASLSEKFGLKRSNHIHTSEGLEVRGYTGVSVRLR